MECACLMVSSLLRYLCWRWWFFRFNYQLSFKRLFAKKTDSFWSFSFESLEVPNLLIWIFSSTRKDSKVFINSISKLVSLTCSFWSAKLDVLVCVTLLFCMGLRKCFFFNCIFVLGIFFFAMWSKAATLILIGAEQMKKNFPPFSTSPVSERTTGFLFLLWVWPFGTRIANNIDYGYWVLL